MNAFEFLSDSDLKVSAASTRLRNLLLGNINKRKKTTQQRKPSTAGKKSEKQIVGDVQQCSTSSVLKNVSNDDCCICSDISFDQKETERRSKVKNNAEFDLTEVARITVQKKVNGINKNWSKNEETINCCETNEKQIKEDKVQKKRKTSSGSSWDTLESKRECVNVSVEDDDEVQQNKEIFDYGNKFIQSNDSTKKTSNDNIVLFVDDSDDIDDDCMVIGTKTTKTSSVSKTPITTEGNIDSQQNSSSCSLNYKSRSINNFNSSKSSTSNECNRYNNETKRYNNDSNKYNSEMNRNNNETDKCNNESNRCNNENNVIKTDYDKTSLRSNTDSCDTADFVTSNCNKSIQGCVTPKKCSNTGFFSPETCTPSTSMSDLFSPNAFSEPSPQTSEKLSPLLQESYIENNIDVVNEKDVKRVMKSYMSKEAVCDSISNSSSIISSVGNSTMIKISKGQRISNCSLDNCKNVSTSLSAVSEDSISTLYSDKLAVSGNLVSTSPSVPRTVDISSSIDTVCKSEQTNIENINVNVSTKDQIPNTEKVLYTKDSINAAVVNTSDDNKFITDDYNTSTLSVTNDSKSSTFFPDQKSLSTFDSKNLLTPNCFTDITAFKAFLERYNNTYTQSKMLCNTDPLSRNTDSSEDLVSKEKKKIESHDMLDETVDIENKFITSRISSRPSVQLYGSVSTPTILYGLREMNLPMFLLFNPYSAKNASPGFNEAMNLLLIIAQVKLCDLPSKWTSAEISKFQSFIRHLQP